MSKKQYIVEVLVKEVNYDDVETAQLAYDNDNVYLDTTDLEFQFSIGEKKFKKLKKFIENKMWKEYKDD